MFGLALADIAWTCGLAVAVSLAIAALASIARRPGESTETRALWIIVVVLLPVLGPVMWFATRRSGSEGSTERRAR